MFCNQSKVNNLTVQMFAFLFILKLRGHIVLGLCVHPSRFLMHAISHESCVQGF